ncbi:MAG: hypothetical protein U0168_14220 [Nannocystaceae bacterium]
MDADLRRRWLATLLLACNCGGASPTAEGPAAAEPATADARDPEPAAVAPRAPPKPRRCWRGSIRAVAVAWLELPAGLDVDAFATVFAMPPKSAKLLRDYVDVELALDAVLPADAPRPATWLSREGFAMLPAIATGAGRAAARAVPEVGRCCCARACRRPPTRASRCWCRGPAAGAPAVFLGEDSQAFVPARRSAPAWARSPPAATAISGDQRELERVLAESPAATVELYASGRCCTSTSATSRSTCCARGHVGPQPRPRMRLLPLLDQGEDPLVTANADATALGEARAVGAETQTVRTPIAGQGQFQRGRPLRRGRLQLPAEDLQALGATP